MKRRESNARLLDSRLFNRNRIQYDCDVTSDGFSSLVYRGDVSRVPGYLPCRRYFPSFQRGVNQIFYTPANGLRWRGCSCKGRLIFPGWSNPIRFWSSSMCTTVRYRKCANTWDITRHRVITHDFHFFPFYIDAVVHTGLRVGQRVYLRADAHTFLRGSVVRHHGE